MFKINTNRLARAGIIASLYVVFSLVSYPIASGAIQFRIGEGLTILPLILPESIPALFIGCILINLLTGCALYDVIFGSLITLLACIFTYLTGKFIKSGVLKVLVGGLFPILLNAIFLPLIWLLCYGTTEYVYYLQVIFLIISQALSVYGIGSFVYIETNKLLKLNSIK